MTTCLLDTNAFSEFVTEGDRIPPRAQAFVETCSTVLLSAITIYEIGQKVRLGKWAAMEPHVLDLETVSREAGYEIMALTSALALKAALLDWGHRDPFDRMIAAVALDEGVPVVSSDAAFDDLGLDRIW